jgi:ankyrin repeat protein
LLTQQLFYFFECAFLGKTDACRTLLQLGADITARDNNGNQPLHLAAHGGANDAMVMFIQEYSVPVDSPGQSGWTALHQAARESE